MRTPLPARAPRLRGARALFTTREGGVGKGPYESLNLARHVGDDDAVVSENRSRVAEVVGRPLVFVDQVHGAQVHVLSRAEASAHGASTRDEASARDEATPRPAQSPVVTADALVTDRADIALAIMVADCMPVLLSEAEAGVIGAAHAGRPGLLAGVLEATVVAMERLGARAERIQAAVGPSACGRCYEVPPDMAEDAARRLPSTRTRTSWGTPAIDLRAGAVEALGRAGVPADAIDRDHPCTIEDPAWFSYRRSRTTGRFAGVIRRG